MKRIDPLCPVRDKIISIACDVCRQFRTKKYCSNYSSKHKENICRSCARKRQPKRKKLTHEQSLAKSLRQIKTGVRYASGYKQLYVHGEHPRKKPYKAGNYVCEHILVMEQNIGRHLERHEIIHHIDKNKLNNDISNLFLCSGEDITNSRKIHNNCHKTAEMTIIELYKKGLIIFKDGNYIVSQTILDAFPNLSKDINDNF